MKNAILLAFIIAAATGCATNKPLEGVRLEAIAPLEIVSLPTPELQRHSPTTIVGGGLLFGGFGMEAVAATDGKRLREQCGLEEFGGMLVREFAAAARGAIPSLAELRVASAPVQVEPRIPGTYVLVVQTGNVWLYTFSAAQGLNIVATASIASPRGSVIWERTGFYSSKNAGRVRPIEELEADSCRLLKEEMRDAASAMVGEWIADLKGVRQ
jgi:hypothetical protein